MPTHAASADPWAHVAENIASVRRRVAEAAGRAGRDPESVQLVAVSKGMSAAAVQAAQAARQRVFGENRVQEALPKIEALAPVGLQWHLIGHLQRNKVSAAAAFTMIESVDSLRLAQALDRTLPQPCRVLLEVNVSGEAAKWGFRPEDLEAALAAIRALPRLQVEGLMTVAPLVTDPEAVRPHFRTLCRLGEAHGLGSLSMGMSHDFEVAIEEGATSVRIGRAIFGAR